MSSMMWLLSAFFLPLFPLSMGFNAVFARLRHPLLRTAMLLIWPQIGVLALSLVTTPIPEWVVALVVLALLTGGLERRFGAAYTGLYGGLAQVLPRFSGVLVFVVLAVIATPVFPAFLAMLSTSVTAVPAAPAVPPASP